MVMVVFLGMLLRLRLVGPHAGTMVGFLPNAHDQTMAAMTTQATVTATFAKIGFLVTDARLTPLSVHHSGSRSPSPASSKLWTTKTFDKISPKATKGMIKFFI